MSTNSNYLVKAVFKARTAEPSPTQTPNLEDTATLIERAKRGDQLALADLKSPLIQKYND
jgi:hypothetical protein